jgi:hypothetical protein
MNTERDMGGFPACEPLPEREPVSAASEESEVPDSDTSEIKLAWNRWLLRNLTLVRKYPEAKCWQLFMLERENASNRIRNKAGAARNKKRHSRWHRTAQKQARKNNR